MSHGRVVSGFFAGCGALLGAEISDMHDEITKLPASERGLFLRTQLGPNPMSVEDYAWETGQIFRPLFGNE